MDKKKIICFSGTRADFGIYRSLLFEIEKDNLFDLKLVVTGMHLLDEYGYTIDEIRKYSFEIIDAPSILFKGDSTYAMSQSVGIAIMYFANILEQSKPDGILLLGDRGEMIAAAIAAHYQNIVTVHLHGGEKSGSADDAIRHAISKLSNFHFVSTNRSKDNLIKMGVEKSSIFVSGSLRKHDVNFIKSIDQDFRKYLKRKYNLSSTKKTVLFVMHPDSKEIISYKEQVDSVITALEGIHNIDIIILGSNSDAGGEVFRKSIKEFSNLNKHVKYFESLPPNEYLFLLSEVHVMIGNSSSGVIEAPFFNLPFLNIGKRQQNREQGSNVYNVPYIITLIEKNLKNIIGEQKKNYDNPYDVLESPATEIVRQMKIWMKSSSHGD